MASRSTTHRTALVVAYLTAVALVAVGLLALLVGPQYTAVSEGMTESWTYHEPSPFGWAPLILGMVTLIGLALRRFYVVLAAAAVMLVTGIPLIFNVGIPLILAALVLAGAVFVARSSVASAASEA